ncbi:hypothetical protein C0033_21220 [Clostridium sp. chh4-2]|uniref:ROK family transcriptional regulator n=1 Tax=Clostridium sp. chh4-2 TaxID=2067550 RepID=UPI000CCEFDE4|nr:winged helix-turn-helix domain-containing protein [Clostridium sp. chh4-2]PNV59988.1 hypothetical protein C0033_21220 [Clostridium sp. chh4-2]
MTKKSLKDVKVNNTAQVLEYIMKNEQISRIEIAEKSGLSPSTVSQAVSLLVEQGLVEELCAGESTGGRKPILLRVRPDFGCIVTVEIRRNGVEAQIFDMTGNLLSVHELSKRKLSGNGLLDAVTGFVKSVKRGEVQAPDHVIGIGLLCQDDIPEYDLMTEFTTSISSDVIRLETALTSSCGVPVKKELINRYHLDYYLKTVDAKCTDYAYINIGERVTASFVLNKTLVHSTGDSVFDISSAVLSGNYAGDERQTAAGAAFAEKAARKFTAEKLAEQLTQVLKSALLFFPINDVFIGGQIEGLDHIVEMVSKEFSFHPVIRKAGEPGGSVNSAFARQILAENYRLLVNYR